MFPHILRKQLRQDIPARRHGGAEPVLTDFRGGIVNLAYQLFRLVQELFTFLQQCAPGGSQMNLPSVTFKKSMSQFPFQLCDLLGHVRLGHSERRRGFREVVQDRRHAENIQFAVYHNDE